MPLNIGIVRAFKFWINAHLRITDGIFGMMNRATERAVFFQLL